MAELHRRCGGSNRTAIIGGRGDFRRGRNGLPPEIARPPARELGDLRRDGLACQFYMLVGVRQKSRQGVGRANVVSGVYRSAVGTRANRTAVPCNHRNPTALSLML